MTNRIDGVINTYEGLLNLRQKLPGVSLETFIDSNVVKILEEELVWLKGLKDNMNGAGDSE